MDCWHDEIDRAMTETEIVQNAGEYLLLWAPRDLPPEALGLRRMRIESRDDVERVHERLVGTPAAMGKGSPRNAHVREIAQYFRHAAARLGELRRIPPPVSQGLSARV